MVDAADVPMGLYCGSQERELGVQVALAAAGVGRMMCPQVEGIKREICVVGSGF